MLLLLMLVACTEDAAEVDDLVRGEEYVQVRMQVPGMKAAATRADDGVIESITALVYRGGVLKKIETATELTTTNFKIPKPLKDDVIHFLANLPDNYSLPAIGTEESALCALTTNRQTLCYWGKYTYNDEAVINTLTLYRNMAMITIAPDPNDECTFPEDQLFIAGLVNANQTGALVPYDEGFNFDLTTNDYFTLPADVETETDAEERPLVTSLYVLEHDNPETEEGLYVICKIGKYYYKVALTSDGVNPYDIIRNHKYTIYVHDLDEGARTYADALTAKPINLEVVEYTDVTLTLTPKASTLYYNSTSEEAVTVTVGGIDSAVETLTFTAPGFTILSDYATDEGNGVFRITNRTKDAINFTLTLTDPNQTGAGAVSVTAAGKYVNGGSSDAAETTITLSERAANSGETIMWQGAVEMHNNSSDGTTHAGKVLIPYSFFFDADGTQKILADSKISLEYNETGYIQTYLFKDGEASIWNISESTELTLTQELLNKIKESHTTVWGVDAAFVFEGGNGAVLNKVTLIPAKESITATADKTQLYYDSDEPQVVTVNVTVPNGVSAITIGGAENFTIANTAGDGMLDGTTYTLGNDRTATFKFTLNAQNVTSQQTITFSGGESVNAAEVTISMAQTPKVTFTNTGAQTIRLNGTPLSVTMDVPDGKTLSEFGITITPATGLNVAQGGNQLTLNNGVYTTTNVSGEQTFTFTPTVAGTYTITFNGQGTDVNMPAENNRTINLTVEAAVVTGMSVTAVNGDSTIDLDSGDTDVTFTLTKPSGVGQLNIGVKDANATNVKNNFSITAGGQNPWNNNDNNDDGYYYNVNNSETVTITVALKNGFNTAGTYTITISDYNKTMSATATITIKKTPTVSFSNTSDKTLYWNNGSPTSFQVQMTGVPDGKSVTLSIANASAFTITASSGTLSATNNGYSYTGGNTTFTIKPKDANSVRDAAYSIGFSGTGDGVIVPNTSISVKVEATQPAVQEIVIYGLEHNNSETGINFGNYLKYDLLGSGGTVGESLKGYFTAGATLVIEVSNIESGAYLNLQTSWTGIFKSYDLANSQDRSYVFSGTDFTGGTFTTDNGNNINNAGLCLVGNKLTITKISIIPASTQQQ